MLGSKAVLWREWSEDGKVTRKKSQGQVKTEFGRLTCEQRKETHESASCHTEELYLRTSASGRKGMNWFSVS